MTLSEFKAWLEGYSASFKDGVPSADQWAEVQKRLDTVEPLKFEQYKPYPVGERPGMTTPYITTPNTPKPIWISDHPGITPYFVGPVISHGGNLGVGPALQ